jgi:hypothetical protein
MNGRARSAQGQGELGHHTAGASSKRTRLVGLLVGAVIAITVVASWVANQPPAPLSATAPADFTVLAAAALLARRRGLATVPRLLIGSAAALIPLVVAPAAAVGLWSALVAIRLGYGELLMGNPYRPEPFRWALAGLTVTVILAWYLLLRRRVGAVALAVGAPARQRSR